MTNSTFHPLDTADRAIPEQSLAFGRFRVLPRQRLLLADGTPIELGTRAFDPPAGVAGGQWSAGRQRAALGSCLAGCRRRGG